MLLSLKYQTDDAFVKLESPFSEIFGKQNICPKSRPEDRGAHATGKDRLNQAGSVNGSGTVVNTSVCPWPTTCTCRNKH